MQTQAQAPATTSVTATTPAPIMRTSTGAPSMRDVVNCVSYVLTTYVGAARGQIITLRPWKTAKTCWGNAKTVHAVLVKYVFDMFVKFKLMESFKNNNGNNYVLRKNTLLWNLAATCYNVNNTEYLDTFIQAMMYIAESGKAQ